MAEIDVDTVKLKDLSKSFLETSNAINEIISNVYDLIDSLPKKNIWVGDSADNFIFITLYERRLINYFSNCLSSYAYFLNSACDKYDYLYSAYRRDDENIH